MRFLIYGITGYTGRLALRAALNFLLKRRALDADGLGGGNP